MPCMPYQLNLQADCLRKGADNIRKGEYEEVAVEIVTELYVDHQLNLQADCLRKGADNIRKGEYEEVAVEIVTELYVDLQFQH